MQKLRKALLTWLVRKGVYIVGTPLTPRSLSDGREWGPLHEALIATLEEARQRGALLPYGVYTFTHDGERYRVHVGCQTAVLSGLTPDRYELRPRLEEYLFLELDFVKRFTATIVCESRDNFEPIQVGVRITSGLESSGWFVGPPTESVSPTLVRDLRAEWLLATVWNEAARFDLRVKYVSGHHDCRSWDATVHWSPTRDDARDLTALEPMLQSSVAEATGDAVSLKVMVVRA